MYVYEINYLVDTIFFISLIIELIFNYSLLKIN